MCGDVWFLLFLYLFTQFQDAILGLILYLQVLRKRYLSKSTLQTKNIKLIDY
jgi:hypothetical protein